MTSLVKFAAAATIALAPLAASAEDFTAAIDAREKMMKSIGQNLGVLVKMAKGETPYDATAAEDAADKLITLAVFDDQMWPKGSDNVALKTTRATPNIWDDLPAFEEKLEDLNVAALKMSEDIGKGAGAEESLAMIRADLGPIGATCKACHELYRGPEN